MGAIDILQIEKRDGRLVEFDQEKIINAIEKAMAETEIGIDNELATEIAETIEDELCDDDCELVGSVEAVQDRVEELLMESERKDVAKAYILYRDERKRFRDDGKEESKYKFLSNDFLSKYKKQNDPFPFELGKFVYYRTYSRPIPEEKRRERWWETVARVVNFNIELQIKAMNRQGLVVNEYVIDKLKGEAEAIYDNMYNLRLFPSGRSLWIGGTKPSSVYSLSNFNCSFMTIDSLEKFGEMFFLLMLGTGVGLSVEKKYISKLPKINTKIELVHRDYEPVAPSQRKEFTELSMKASNIMEIVVGDSKFAWMKAIDFYFEIMSSKQYSDIEFVLINYNNVRKAGERLKTFGGYSSGHEAIKGMFQKIDDLFKSKHVENKPQWQSLKPIDVLDISTIIAENVVSGGTRRSAEIVFCDPDETDVINAKQEIYYQNGSGNWESNEKIIHRMLSNNTILYNEKPTKEQLIKQFESIKTSGEPAFGNMAEMKNRRDDVQGGNPCFEILLRDRGVCNLTEVNMMGFVNEDGYYNRELLMQTQRHSARMGYRMATIELELHEWDLVNQEDRLTGCSITGLMDFVNATKISESELRELLREMKHVAKEEVRLLSSQLKMKESKLVTCVKPSGTISQLPTVSSGVHYSHSPYYVRRVRVSANDPLSKAMEASGFKWSPEVGQTKESHKTKVFEFPVKAPEGKTKYDVSAIEQLELYKLIMEEYVDHNASNTIHVKPHEWEEVVDWVYENWDSVVGITFLPLDDSFYQLLPYESITEEEYWNMMEVTPKFNPNILREFENFEDEFEILDEECDTGVCPVR